MDADDDDDLHRFLARLKDTTDALDAALRDAASFGQIPAAGPIVPAAPDS